MVYEVEKRAWIASLAEFARCNTYLQECAEFQGERVFKTFLFREPSYLRIRIVQNDPLVTITHKKGSYEDPAREETERKIYLSDLPSFLRNLKKGGFIQCASLASERLVYRLQDGLVAELNRYKQCTLGMIAEVEALTDDQSEIPALRKRALDVLEELHLQELDPQEYQRIIDDVYARLLMPVSQHLFHF